MKFEKTLQFLFSKLKIYFVVVVQSGIRFLLNLIYITDSRIQSTPFPELPATIRESTVAQPHQKNHGVQSGMYRRRALMPGHKLRTPRGRRLAASPELLLVPSSFFDPLQQKKKTPRILWSS
jgi:hypothetical protein